MKTIARSDRTWLGYRRTSCFHPRSGNDAPAAQIGEGDGTADIALRAASHRYEEAPRRSALAHKEPGIGLGIDLPRGHNRGRAERNIARARSVADRCEDVRARADTFGCAFVNGLDA